MRFPSAQLVRCCIAVAVILSISAPAARADVATLYDPQLGTPGTQGWIPVVPSPAVEMLSGNLLRLDTTANRGTAAGYFSANPFNGSSPHPQMPVLDRLLGYTISFDLQVVSEGHATRDDNGDTKDDRAGFSVIAISQDLLGLELGFFEDRIWAYAAAGEGANSLFTQAEGVAFDTTLELTHFDLTVQGNSYRLSDGVSELLTGTLRNYNPSGVNVLINPYDNPSFLFLGDDTSSADSHVLLGSISVTTVPEPSTFALMLFATGGLVSFGLRRRLHHKAF